MVDITVQLSSEERKILNLVAEHQFSQIEPMRLGELLLEFPTAQSAAVRAAAQILVSRELLVSGGWPGTETLALSALGMLNTSHSGDAAALAEGLLEHLHRRLRTEKGQFRKYTWDDLKSNGVVGGDEEFGRAVTVVTLFNLSRGGSYSLGPPATATWDVPADVADLRSIQDVLGLYARVKAVQQQSAVEAPNHVSAESVHESLTVLRYGSWIRGKRLGKGGQGTAYRAWNGHTGEVGALKLLHPEHDAGAQQARARFSHELRAIRSIVHPCVLKVLDMDLEADEPWVVTEFFPMGSLHTALKSLKGDVWRSLRLARDVANALAEAHAKDIVHRDVKPQNILLRTMDHAVLGDFGIAHISDATQLTDTNEKVGAQWFRPPEADDGRIDNPLPSFDVYSLGKVIYVCLSGGERFKREGFRKDQADLVSRLQRPELETVNRLLDSMIVEEPSKRFQRMDEVICRIDETLGELFGRGPIDQCRACRIGQYVPAGQGAFQGDGGTNLFVLEDGRTSPPSVEICPVCGDIRVSVTWRRKAWLKELEPKPTKQL